MSPMRRPTACQICAQDGDRMPNCPFCEELARKDGGDQFLRPGRTENLNPPSRIEGRTRRLVRRYG